MKILTHTYLSLNPDRLNIILTHLFSQLQHCSPCCPPHNPVHYTTLSTTQPCPLHKPHLLVGLAVLPLELLSLCVGLGHEDVYERPLVGAPALHGLVYSLHVLIQTRGFVPRLKHISAHLPHICNTPERKGSQNWTGQMGTILT